MKPQWDLILVGGGLANGLIAAAAPASAAAEDAAAGSGRGAGRQSNRSFHQDDLTPAQHARIAPLVAHRWSGYDVRFPALTRRLDGGYLSITSGRFAAVIAEALGDSLRTRTPVSALTPETVTLADGSLLRASAVIDGRGYQPCASDYRLSGVSWAAMAAEPAARADAPAVNGRHGGSVGGLPFCLHLAALG